MQLRFKVLLCIALSLSALGCARKQLTLSCKGDVAPAEGIVAASADDVNAQYQLTFWYFNAYRACGNKRFAEQGYYWLQKAAEGGLPRAQTSLAESYYTGRVSHVDYIHAAEWYRKAAEQGFAPAQANLGTMYYLGRGVIKDMDKARYWLKQAADQGYSDAIRNLSVIEK